MKSTEREIKFRAWDKSIQKIQPVLGIIYDSSDANGNVTTAVKVPNDRWLHGVSFELMQYTGLKDRHGKEIYDGDIVSGQIWSWKEPRVFEVKWNDNGYQPFLEQYMTKEGEYHLYPSTCEVIGNIYEHPELLTKGNDVAGQGSVASTDSSNPQKGDS